MLLLIRNMLSERCGIAVRTALGNLGLPYRLVAIGSIETSRDFNAQELALLEKSLESMGLGFLQNASQALVDGIERCVLDYVYHTVDQPLRNFSALLSEKLNHNYTYLSNLFSGQTGFTITQCLIRHRIGRAKDLLRQQELSLTRIADLLHYSSVGQLSAQFRKITGITPTSFRRALPAA